jgi:hypothetical protein
MICLRCGIQLDHLGQGHSCVTAPVSVAGPPLRWQAALWTLLALAVLFAGLSLVRAAINADLIVSPRGPAVTVLSIAVPLALFFAFVAWSNLTKRVIEAPRRHGRDRPELGRLLRRPHPLPVVPPADEDPGGIPCRTGSRSDPAHHRLADHPQQARAVAR